MDVYNIFIKQGTDFYFFVKIPDTDLTGYSARGKIKSSATDMDSVADFSFDFESPVLPETDWKIKVYLTNSNTESIPTTGKGWNNFERYQYDIELVSPTGFVSRLLQGTVDVSPEITK